MCCYLFVDRNYTVTCVLFYSSLRKQIIQIFKYFITLAYKNIVNGQITLEFQGQEAMTLVKIQLQRLVS